MKNNFFLRTRLNSKVCILFFLILGIYSCQKNENQPKETLVDLRSETSLGTSCFDNLEAQCFPPNIVTYPIVLTNVAGYSGCSFNVDVTYSDCLVNGAVQLFFGDFVITSINCPQYDIDFINAQSAGGLVFQNFLATFDLSMYKAIELYFINLYGAPACGLGASSTISWHLSSCVQRCFKATPDGKGGTTYLQIAIKECGLGCCIRQTSFCRTPTGEFIPTTTTTSIPNNAVCESTSNGFPVSLACNVISACFNRCEVLTRN